MIIIILIIEMIMKRGRKICAILAREMQLHDKSKVFMADPMGKTD